MDFIKRITLTIFLTCISLFSQVDVETYRLRNDTSKITYHFDLSGIYAIGNNDNFSFASTAKINYNYKKIELISLSYLNLSNSNQIPTGDDGYTHLRGLYKIDSTNIIEMFYQKGFNHQMLIEERNLTGCGLKFILLNDKHSSSVGIGTFWENQYFLNNTMRNDLKASTYLTLFLDFNKIKIQNVMYFQINFEDSKDCSILTNTKFKTPLTDNIFAFFNFKYNKYGYVLQGVYNYDFQTKIGLDWNF